MKSALLQWLGQQRYQRGIVLCEQKGDHGTREFLAAKLTDEEAHADWLETQLDLIARVGIAHYIGAHIRS